MGEPQVVVLCETILNSYKNKSRGARPRLPESVISGYLLPLSYAGVNRIRFKGSPLPRISVLANSPSWLTRKSA